MSGDVGELSVVLVEELAAWETPCGGLALVGPAGVLAAAGEQHAVLPWASVTKLVAALAVLTVVEEGLLDLDDPAGPPGSTVRHLLAHASGLAPDEDRVLAAPGSRRSYSNRGIDLVVEVAGARAGAPDAASLLTQRVLEPLGMTATALVGPPAHGAHGPLADLARLAVELLAPRVLPSRVVDALRAPAFPGLAGVLPGFGRQDPNDWGLGAELRGRKEPHWTSPDLPPEAFGHFGQSGSFVWVDRAGGLALVALTGRPFGPWAAQAWPRTTARVRAAHREQGLGAEAVSLTRGEPR